MKIGSNFFNLTPKQAAEIRKQYRVALVLTKNREMASAIVIHDNLSLLQWRWLCSSECIAKVDMGEHADVEVWHHIECPNHTTACCDPDYDRQ